MSYDKHDKYRPQLLARNFRKSCGHCLNKVSDTSKLRRNIVYALSLPIMSSLSPAFAQNDAPSLYPSSESVRTAQDTIDMNGVNVIALNLSTKAPSISVGDPQNGGLSFHFDYNQGQLFHNFAMYISDPYLSPYNIPYTQNNKPYNMPNFQTLALLDSGSEKFAAPSSPGQNVSYSNVSATQGILKTGNITTSPENTVFIGNSNLNSAVTSVGHYIYTDKRGSIYTLSTMGAFNNNFNSGRSSFWPATLYYAPVGHAEAVVTSISRPNGDRLNLFYEISVAPTANSYLVYARLRSVVSNRGYQINLYYSLGGTPTVDWRGSPPPTWMYPATVQAINLGLGSCDSFASTCAGPQVVATQNLAMTSSVGCTDPDQSNLAYTVMATLSITNQMSETTKYEMDCHSNLTAITTPTGRKLQATYNRIKYIEDVQVSNNEILNPVLYSISAIDVGGLHYGYAQSGDPQCGLFLGWNTSCGASTYSVTRTSPDGSLDVFSADRSNSVLLSSADGINRITRYDEDGFGRITKKTLPEGNGLSFGYDSRGNILSILYFPKSGSTVASITEAMGYETSCSNAVLCNRPRFFADGRGNEIDYTYDSTSGNVTSITWPADSSGTRGQRRFAYAPMNAYFYGSSGSIAPSSSPVVLLTGTSECRTTSGAAISGTAGVGPFAMVGAASCAGYVDEAKEAYSYGPQVAGTANNLLPISVSVSAGDGSTVATTAKTYDSVGNISAVTDPNGNISYKTYDSARRLAFEIGRRPDSSSPRPIVHHVYDADGHEVRTESGTGTATDGSDFVVVSFKRMTFDTVTGLLTKTEEVLP